ncbi:non-symbiotic hemoglobin 1-like [Colias croceus]|uniref:non-symbiotic hemoglobin 1-like n=1 Tax=Colias crocea TaxID=72248 RepID=UPI001E27A9C6|nr:non-symbiotic hemoglobin 1-like [Colias croceus]
MGSWYSRLLWGGDPDEVNPVSGLSRRDIYLVQKSWAVVYADALANGTELFKGLFRVDPTTLTFFKMLKNVPEEEFGNNFQFRAHVLNLMTSFNQAVINLHQPEVVIVLMNKLGESHRKRRIVKSHFDDLKGVLVKMFIEVLKLDESTLGSWGKTVDFLYKHIFETLSKNEMTS